MMGLDYLLLTGDHPIPGQGGYFGDLAPIHGPIVVGEDAFIGARAIILPGEQIGRGATGEAGALLDKMFRLGHLPLVIPRVWFAHACP